jgi:hypothetical protein
MLNGMSEIAGVWCRSVVWLLGLGGGALRFLALVAEGQGRVF